MSFPIRRLEGRVDVCLRGCKAEAFGGVRLNDQNSITVHV
jgi:hypothetical protein